MKRILFLAFLLSFAIGCQKESTEGLLTKEEALAKVSTLDETYYYAERFVSNKIIGSSQKIKYDYWDREETITSPKYKSWLICYDMSAFVNGGSQVLVFVNAENGEYSTSEINSTEIYVDWDSKYYYCPPSDVIPPWGK